MNIIYCDSCRFEWPAGETKIESIVLNEQDDVKMRYFQCPECGKEYLVDITDRDIRKNIALFKKMKKKYIKMYNARESEIKIRNYLNRMEAFKAEIVAKEAELKRKWTSGK